MSRKTTHIVIKEVPTFQWRTPSEYAPGVEVISMTHLYRRATKETDQRSTRFEFFMLAGVTSGEMVHAVDFLKIPSVAGTWLLVRPGQLQQFFYSAGLEGWVIMFRPDFLPPNEGKQKSPFHVLASQLNDFPPMVQLDPADQATCCAIAQSMQRDLQDNLGGMGDQERNALLLYQLCELLTRLKVSHQRGDQVADPALKADWARVSRLRKLIESNFCAQHSVNWYASELGCTIKTLGRATIAVTGQTAKTMITDRIMLEAKRQLVHSQRHVQSIAHDLGFDETSNFIKFFKKETACTPTAFREQWHGPSAKSAG